MNILIIGGTRFVGRHLVEHALSRGHTVTLFNRGESNPGLYPDVEALRGDRRQSLALLEGRTWDAVVDTCGYIPREVRASTEMLAGAAALYAFISSISAFADFSKPGIDETSPLAEIEDLTTEEVNGDTYGGLKVLCERAAEQAMPGRVLVVRPGLIVGRYDTTGRFSYWPHRIAQGGDVLAPAPPHQPVQFIDGRDLAAWTIESLEGGLTGAYNTVGPADRLTMGEMLLTCVRVDGGTARLVWVDEDFLIDHQVRPWTDLPLWVGEKSDMTGVAEVSCSRAIAAGLRFRPLVETVRDTLAWVRTLADDHSWKSGISREREAALLQAWRAGEQRAVQAQ